MEPIIEFKDFSFKYRAQQEPTLKDINLKIYPGEKVLIVGPSGSGKSTLAHLINGLVPFSYEGDIKGTYKIKGKNPRELGIFGLSQMVGTVLQDTDGQFVGLTVAEDIAFSLENDCEPLQTMKKKVDDAAKMVDIIDLLDHAPAELSGGQKQRVSMAGVLVNQVEILLFDEPLANLDPATGKRTIELIDTLQSKNETTVLIIEHRLEDVLHKSVDRIIVIGQGRIVADTTPDELLSLDVLDECGIREPLYITSLKHAGCNITPDVHPASIETIALDSYKQNVQNWFAATDPVPVKVSDKQILSIDHVSFSYDEQTEILNDISFDVHRGEMLAIVGKNGAGKTTLSSLICGFNDPTSGTILLNGENINRLSIKERGERIGLVMQNPNQMISKPMIYDEVALGLVVRGVPEEEIKSRVYETLEICGLYKMRNWPVSALSFGQKKRVTIASILVLKPDIVILDEPTAGQDYRHYTEIMEFLKKLNEEQGITIIMITHDMHLMLEYTNRSIVLADGHMIADDSPAAILTDEKVSEKAYLKKTSLYELALRCDISDAAEFVERFICYDRSKRRKDEEYEQ